MPNELLKDLMGLEGLSDFGLSFSVECDNCEHYGDITEEQRNSDTIYPAEQKKTCQNNWGGCKDATLRYIAKKLAELGYRKVVLCKDCKHEGHLKGEVKLDWLMHWCRKYRAYIDWGAGCTEGAPKEDKADE